jgi:hypothetical protein
MGCGAVMISVVMKMVCITQKIFVIPEIIFPVAQKIISMFATIFCISQIHFAKTRKMVEETQKHF